MAIKPKKWVFNLLVKNPDNPSELIAYAIYKADKNEHAKYVNGQTDLSPEQINQKLSEFHDSVASSTRKQKEYKEKSKRILEELVSSISSNINKVNEEKLKKKQQDWCTSAIEYSKSQKKVPYYMVVGKWLLSGLSSLLATYITTILLLGTIAIFSQDMRTIAKKTMVSVTQTLMSAGEDDAQKK
ncbi:TPA: hypothetical protein ACXNIW_002550 [Proteus mirabilis]